MDSTETLKRLSGVFYEDLATSLAPRLKERGIDERLAGVLANIAVKHMAASFAGMNAYFPKNLKLTFELRDEQIFCDIEHVPLHELVEKHGISEMRIRQIVWGINEQIREEFNGANWQVLADKNGVSVERIQRIIIEEKWK